MSRTRDDLDLQRVEEEAAEWLLRLEETGGEDDRRAFEDWRAADPMHARVYEAQSKAWSAIGALHDRSELKREAVAKARRRSPARAVAAALAASLALAVGAVFALQSGLITFTEEPALATAVGEIRTVTLEDGSIVTIGARSAIEVAFTETERLVHLTTGEAFFDVAKNPARPFIVEAAGTRVRAVGTQFDVHMRDTGVTVSVVEGVVEVKPPTAKSAGDERPDAETRLSSDLPSEASAKEGALAKEEAQILVAGQRLASVAETEAPPVIEAVEPEAVAPWREGRLVFIDARLADVIADANRHYRGRIVLGDKSVGEMQLTASFRTDEIDRMLEVLTAALPVEAEHLGRDRIVLRRRTDAGG